MCLLGLQCVDCGEHFSQWFDSHSLAFFRGLAVGIPPSLDRCLLLYPAEWGPIAELQYQDLPAMGVVSIYSTS